MEAKAAHFITLAVDWFTSLPNHWLFTIGVVVASLPLTALILQYVKHLHFKWNGTEMTSHLIDFTLWVTGFLMAAADFVITNGENAKYLPQFLLVVVPVIKAAAPSIYTYSKAINSWTKNRQNETQKQRFSAVLNAADGVINQPGFAPLSNGTQANNISAPETQQPRQQSPDLLQL